MLSACLHLAGGSFAGACWAHGECFCGTPILIDSERKKMAAGEWYCCLDAELDALRVQARDAVHAHNTLPPRQRGNIAPDLAALFAEVAAGAFIEAPFHCSYGMN